jgi:hypothetical protein
MNMVDDAQGTTQSLLAEENNLCGDEGCCGSGSIFMGYHKACIPIRRMCM